ncbi:MAG: HEPN domain-containing protein [Nitrospinales bacterium]
MDYLIYIGQRYVRSRTSPEVRRFVNGKIKQFRNPGKEEMLKLYGSFSPDMRKTLEDEIDEELWSAAGSIVSQRNTFAHGRNEGISLGQIENYYERAYRLMNKIGDEFK